MKPKNKKVYVAMSGGVDSSVAAALLKKEGFDIVGVYFKPWSPETDKSFCNWQEDRLDAARVAEKLGIEFKTWDFSKEYGKKVAQYMIDSYKYGTTPNPDVMCNKEIKFGLFLKKAIKEGADYIATGHYVQKADLRGKKNSALLIANDSGKDQSYFLYNLTQDQLKYCLFPIGKYKKSKVRELAKKFGLANHGKKDSQGVCFVGQLDIKDFLKKYIKSKPGEIILESTGEKIGFHDGAAYYTIGQRHGLDIKNGQGPYFISSKNIKKNIIYVAKEKSQLAVFDALVSEISWVGDPIKFPANISVKIRYRSESVPATILKTKDPKKVSVKFKKPAIAPTPGQSMVFYKGKYVLGGGVII